MTRFDSGLISPNPNPNYKWHVVGMLWFCGFFNYADRQAIFSVFPLLADDRGVWVGVAGAESCEHGVHLSSFVPCRNGLGFAA